MVESNDRAIHHEMVLNLKKWGYTTKEIASICQVSVATVNNWVRPTTPTLPKSRPYRILETFYDVALRERNGMRDKILGLEHETGGSKKFHFAEKVLICSEVVLKLGLVKPAGLTAFMKELAKHGIVQPGS